MMALVACSEVKDVTRTWTPAPANNQVSQPAATRPAAATPIPPTATASPKVIGQPTILEGNGGRFSITVNAITDPATSTNQFNTPKGRWVVVDWTVKNEGTADIRVGYSDFRVLTSDSFEIQRGNHAGHKTPELEPGTLGPGQSTRGFVAYDVPSGAKITAAIFHASGSPQFVIATVP